MDPALKQRLIGAAVLVALAVIFLPMLLGGPEPTTTPRSEVSLDMPPAPDRPLQTREIPLTLPATPPRNETPAPVDPGAVVAVDVDAAPRVDARPEDAPATPPAVSQPVAPEAAAGPAAPSTASASAPAAAPPAADAPAADATAPNTSSTATPVANAPPAADTAAASGTRFAVNLGSYGNTANAEALRARLRQSGLAVYAESIQIDGKPATRLRAGPYASRGEAEAARGQARRQQADLPATVVVLDDDAPGAAPPRAAVAAGFAVQVGALKAESEANALAARLRGAGFSAWVERTRTDEGTLWRVRAGPELQRARAERLRDDIRARLQLDGMVVGHP